MSLDSAMRDACLHRLDDRGLMPLAEARDLLAGVTVFRRGEGEMVDGRFVLESDRVWAALLSLEDAEEFVTRAAGLRWEANVRGMDNIAPYERYGDGVLPWIATRVDEKGVLHNEPWCVLPCLLASDAEEAFGIASAVRDTDVLIKWVVRHPEPGYRLLADRVSEGTVADALRELHRIDPRGTVRRLELAGADRARHVLDRLGLVTPPLPDAVRAALDAAPRAEGPGPSLPLSMAELDECFGDWEYPMWENANYFCTAMRMTGFITPGGTDGLVFESLVTGLGERSVRVEFHRFGFGLRFGWVGGLQHDVIGEEDAGAIEERRTWRGRALEPHPGFGRDLGPLEVVMLSLDPGEVFLPPERLKELLALPASAEPLFALDEWTGPGLEEPASSAEDLVLAVEALRARRAIPAALNPRPPEHHLRERIALLGGWGEDW
ncbi:hypothetical protein ACQP1W_44145 [Spirillospora sp. CA-255316]